MGWKASSDASDANVRNFEIFVPGVEAGASYQYEIKIKGGDVQRKSDPYGNGTQGAPSVISVVTELGIFMAG